MPKLDRNLLYHKACAIATQNSFVFKGEELAFYYQFNPLIKLIISPKPNDGLLICVENQISASPIFLDRDGENLIEPIIEMIALLARRESQS